MCEGLGGGGRGRGGAGGRTLYICLAHGDVLHFTSKSGLVWARYRAPRERRSLRNRNFMRTTIVAYVRRSERGWLINSRSL